MKPKQEPLFSTLASMEIEIAPKDPKPEPNSPLNEPDETFPPFEKGGQGGISHPHSPASPRPALVPFHQVPFVHISPGSFMMGSPEQEPGRADDETPHEVILTKAFAIQATPVTRGQWQDVMGNNPACFQQGGDDCPVEGVSWNDCQAFIQRLNAEEKGRYRLPTEAEWEFACRAGTITAFANGGISQLFCRLDPCLDVMGWYCGNSGRQTHPVARKLANAWGVFDMHGNVCEWCQDWYGVYAAGPQTDPSGPDSGPGRVVRGGSWFSNSQNCRSASRFYRPPNARADFVGFRLVRQ